VKSRKEKDEAKSRRHKTDMIDFEVESRKQKHKKIKFSLPTWFWCRNIV